MGAASKVDQVTGDRLLAQIGFPSLQEISQTYFFMTMPFKLYTFYKTFSSSISSVWHFFNHLILVLFWMLLQPSQIKH